MERLEKLQCGVMGLDVKQRAINTPTLQSVLVLLYHSDFQIYSLQIN